MRTQPVTAQTIPTDSMSASFTKIWSFFDPNTARAHRGGVCHPPQSRGREDPPYRRGYTYRLTPTITNRMGLITTFAFYLPLSPSIEFRA
jgi:hypothetical protein